jgi:hypothetical protein
VLAVADALIERRTLDGCVIDDIIRATLMRREASND